MARPTKQGIDYFPVDVQFDDKIELLIAEKGSEALAILITIWQLIYQNEGYYIASGKDLFLLIKRRIMTDVLTSEEVVNIALERNIFDKKLYKKHKILTSKAIQKRYFEASKRKKTVYVDINYLCLGINVNNYSQIIYINATNVEEEVKEEVKEEVEEKRKPTGNPDEPKKPAAFAPPPLIEYQEYFLEYAKRKYSDLFPVSKIKCDSFSENDYHYWFDDDCKIMKKKKYSSWKRVAQTSVRSLNTKLKDWEVANSTPPAVTPGVYRNGKEALI